MMQGIMWIILGGTLALAGLVDSHRAARRDPQLRDPITIDGVTLRLPADWRVRGNDDSQFPIVAIDDGFGRVYTVDVQTLGMGELFGMAIDRRRGRQQSRGDISLGMAKVPLILRQIHDDEDDEDYSEFTATRRLGAAQRITVKLLTAATSRPQVAAEETLFRRLVSEIHFENDSPPAATAPATTPSE
jgi:hypothetical protein